MLLKTLPALLLVSVAVACSKSSVPSATPTAISRAIAVQPQTLAQAREKIKHVVIIMQENRSFDNYFGAFPGADGIPMDNGVPTVCVPDDTTGPCVASYHDTALLDAGGPHAFADTATDVNGGKMDGFVNE